MTDERHPNRSKPRSTTAKRRNEKSKPVRRTTHKDADAAPTTTSGEPRGSSTQPLSTEPPSAGDDEAATRGDESPQGDTASRGVEEAKTEVHRRPVEAPLPLDNFDDATCHKSQQLLSAQAVLDGAAKHQAVLEAELHEHRAELSRLNVAQRVVDEDLMCPISSELMKDPVFARDGHTYERCCIEQWFATGASTSPLTNEALSSLDLVPNIFARKKVAEFLDKCRRAPEG